MSSANGYHFNPLQQAIHNSPRGSRSGGLTKCIPKVASVLNQNPRKLNQDYYKERIRKRLCDVKLEVSPSAYDTAWVAMVPGLGEYSGRPRPRFEQCLQWVMENQNWDGSWGLNPGHPSLVKDSLSCTLACVLALRTWNLGHRLLQRGLDYIGSNAWAASSADQLSPIGFNIVFPAMVDRALKLDLTLPLKPTLIDSLLFARDAEIRLCGSNDHLAYVSEGLGDYCDWKQLFKHRRINGSLFNSPATTAAALIQCPDDHKSIQYLATVVESFDGWVPAVYPMHIHAHLRLVDTIERLGVNRHFRDELHNILDEIYRAWLAKDEGIFSDISCLAMAFRLLRTNGYDVSSDELAAFVDEDKFFETCGIQNTGVATCLELYRASQMRIYEDEQVLEKILIWTRDFLKQQVLDQNIPDKKLCAEVEHDLKNFYGKLDRVSHRRSIELCEVEEFQMLKTAYRCRTIFNEDLAMFAAKDFRISQAKYHKELKQVQKWFTDCNMDGMKQSRDTSLVSSACAAGVLFPEPEFAQARIGFTQFFALATFIDDFIDNYGSKEEAIRLLELFRIWDEQKLDGISDSSREVKIMYTALCKTIDGQAEMVYAMQGHCIKHDLHEMWIEFLSELLNEKGWGEKKITTMDQYISTSCTTFGLKFYILLAYYFLGHNMPEGLLESPDFYTMLHHASLVGRLLNDTVTYKREQKEGGLNFICMLTAGGTVSEEEAISMAQQMAEDSQRKVLQMVCLSKGNMVPRRCQEFFWALCKMGNWLYNEDGGDRFSSMDKVVDDINKLILEPLELPRIVES
ncbi:nezukol synthase KSL3-like isoform X2 [Andrographis paniculata]|uniref:nezukol synthase KSL3-like isoform X2 n=1 Tax=Andrographis paniculata TaxID=175694 RepID=UPI0021E8D663|nr:nezukol synthase KSL3-like isoform X2 [Andrographis paniculata]